MKDKNIMSKKYLNFLKWFTSFVIITLISVVILPVLIGNNKIVLKKYNRIEINTIDNSKNLLINEQEDIEEFKKYTSKISFKPSFNDNNYDYIISFYNDSHYETTLFYDSVRKTFKINVGIFFTDSISQEAINPQFDSLLQKYIKQL